MSDTPRTDARIFRILSSLQSGTEEVVHAEFAKDLERELSLVNGYLSELHALVVGECFALLDETRGGNSKLCLEIEDVLSKHRTDTP